MMKSIYAFGREYMLYRKNISLFNFFKFARHRSSRKEDELVGIRPAGFEHLFYLRKNGVDFSIFRDFFLQDDYVSTLPDARAIIDAGANVGAATLTFKKRYPDAEIIAVEPDEQNCELFRKNTEYYNGITLLQGGLASRNNEFMNIVDSSVSPYSFQMQYSSEGLPSFSINAIMEERGWTQVDIVKLDIEGGEREVLSANTEWLSVTKQLIIELHDYKLPGCSQALIQALKDHDFEIDFSGENLVLTKSTARVG